VEHEGPGTSDESAADRVAAVVQRVVSLIGEGNADEALVLVPELLAADDDLFRAMDLGLTKSLSDAAARLLPTRRYDLLEPLMLKDLRNIEQHPSARPGDVIPALYQLAGLYDLKGDAAACSGAASAIVNLAERLVEPVDGASLQVLLQLGKTFEESREYAATAILYRLADRSLEAMQDLAPEARVDWSRRYGAALERDGQYAEAISAYRSGLALLDAPETVDERVALLGSIAGAAQALDDPPAVETAYREVCDLLERSGRQDSQLAGVASHNLAAHYVAHHQAGRYEDAERLARRAVAIGRRSGTGPTSDHGASIALLAQIVAARGDMEEANRLYEEAVQTFDAAPETRPGDLADYLTDWGRHLLEWGRPGDAVVQFARALEIRESLDAPVPADTLSDLATAQFEAGALNDALQSYRRALDVRHRMLGAG
jgi:tetratricopeptide (TPR) repeat protein